MEQNSKINIEIEKKYIIAMPDVSRLSKMPEYGRSEITQIYLPSSKGETHRVRKRVFGNNATFTETRKIRIDKMSSTEIEREISELEFKALSATPLEGTYPIIKVRHTFVYEGQLFEIDVYPQWASTAIMETELNSRGTVVKMPNIIRIIKDVTGDKRYSNASMSREFPSEECF